MYAIIVTGGKQYKVSEGDIIDVELLNAAPGDEVTFDNVVALSDGTLKVADETKGAKVTGKVLSHGKGRKVTVYRYKPKSGYHKKNGHRQPYTRVQIGGISL